MDLQSKKYFKHFITILIGIFLFLPLIESKTNFIDVIPLQGDTSSVEMPVFSFENFTNAKWQENFSEYTNKNFGFRSLVVRCFNQIRYSFFNKITAPGIVVAKNGDLIIEAYIDEYIGKNFKGKSFISNVVEKIKRVQDSLKTRGTDLIVVFAPGRASFDPEIIPDSYIKEKKDSTNYSVYRGLMLKNKINFLDFNSWFSQNKNNFKHKIYPKYGAHWNHYGMCLALDSIIKYMEQLQGINLPDFDFSEVKYSSDLKNNDFDIGVLMNTLFPVKKDSNPYPQYKINGSANSTKPDVLFIGDSYWWCLVGENLPLNFFREDEYWFYYKQQLIQNKKIKQVDKLNLQSSLASRKTVVIIASEATYHLFPFGFIDNVFKLYCEDHKARLVEILNNIYQNKEWYSSVLKKAEENHVSIEKQIKLDAEYVLSDEIFNPLLNMDSIVKLIIKNEEWMKEIQEKSKKNNISIEVQIKLDAKWYFENQTKTNKN